MTKARKILGGKTKRYLLVGIDRVCKNAYVELHKRMTQPIARSFLEHLIKDSPFTIHPILTENGPQLTYALLPERLSPQHKIHLFDQTCAAHRIRHRLTKFRHPGTNGQVEGFNRKIKGHTPKRDHYATANQLTPHLMAFLLAYNFQRPLKALKYQSPDDTVIQISTQKPELFHDNPLQEIVGLNN
ncbi:MAG: integrase core domain-containing protein [Nitrospirae bacterium]|nr:integrase core domain-containing protein [Nitrospirota bacterium]MDA1304518.1 integrase core domain-containing protein [Nitrospirota bacterium]